MLRTIEELLTPPLASVLRGCCTGTCELLDPWGKHKSLTPPRFLSESQLTQLTGMILDLASWSFCKKRCLPRPTALFRLQGALGGVTVKIGMPCADWTIMGANYQRGGFFDPVEGQVRALLKSLYLEFASLSPQTMWRAGAITKLRTAIAGKAKPRSAD